MTFTAAPAHRAKADGTCEPLPDRRLELSVFVRRTGCTKAGRIVDAWRANRDCVTKALDLRSCRVAGRRCAPVLGGRLADLAGVACRSGRSQIELVVSRACGGPGLQRYEVRAINLGCVAAQDVAAQWAGHDGCARHACTVAGWRCSRPSGSPERTRCRRGHAAVPIRARVMVSS